MDYYSWLTIGMLWTECLSSFVMIIISGIQANNKWTTGIMIISSNNNQWNHWVLNGGRLWTSIHDYWSTSWIGCFFGCCLNKWRSPAGHDFQRWMVFVRENPNLRWMITRGTPIFGNHQMDWIPIWRVHRNHEEYINQYYL